MWAGLDTDPVRPCNRYMAPVRQPGVAAELPDDDLRPDRHGHLQRLAAGRGHGRRRGHDHVQRHRARQEAQVPGVGEWAGGCGVEAWEARGG